MQPAALACEPLINLPTTLGVFIMFDFRLSCSFDSINASVSSYGALDSNDRSNTAETSHAKRIWHGSSTAIGTKSWPLGRQIPGLGEI